MPEDAGQLSEILLHIPPFANIFLQRLTYLKKTFLLRQPLVFPRYFGASAAPFSAQRTKI
jgi:hypothetical protein